MKRPSSLSSSAGGAPSYGTATAADPTTTTEGPISCWWKRDMCYAALTVVTFPLPFVLKRSSSSTTEEDEGVTTTTTLLFVGCRDLAQHVIDHNEIPTHNILLLVALETIKVLITNALFTNQQDHQYSKHNKQQQLPFFSATAARTNADHLHPLGQINNTQQQPPTSTTTPPNRTTTTTGNKLYQKSVELCRSVWNLVAAVAATHAAFVLFGAPLIQNFGLTLSFSVILATLTLFPLYLSSSVSPAATITHLAYVSAWPSSSSFPDPQLSYSRLRLLLTVLVGPSVGSLFLPLDWDRPWQKWPLTSLASTLTTFYAINVAFFLYGVIRCARAATRNRRSQQQQQQLQQQSSTTAFKSKIKYY